MKDIDFDELDKAVNSLMAGSSRVEPKILDTPTETTLEIIPSTPSQSADSVAVAPSPKEAQSSDAQSLRLAQPVPAVRRSGRFMDMIPKNPDSAVRQAPAAPSREGVQVTPRPDVNLPSRNEAVANTDTVQVKNIPDPIEVANDASVSSPNAKASVSAEPGSGLRIPIAETPFLVDAKVDKRPLNAESTAANDKDTDDEYLIDTSPSDREDIRGADEPPVVPVVPELDNDLVEIETGGDRPATQAVETVDAIKEVDQPPTPLGATSIAQQYVPQPSTGDQSHAAIYDASQYPEPVAHPAKKKAGWLWVLWVVLLLGVGAGVAILLYVLGIIP
jgi:hypothetical protein